MARTLSLVALLAFVPYLASATNSAHTVKSEDGNAVYTCPTYETIETAYFGYCPNKTPIKGLPLVGVESNATYPGAPQSWKVPKDSYSLTCFYAGSDAGTYGCEFLGGGGSPLYQAPQQSRDCPTNVNTPTPQPSPGVNPKPNNSGKVAQQVKYVCPRSNDQGWYLNDTAITSGQTVDGDKNLGFTYLCDFTDGHQKHEECSYVQKNNTVTLFGNEGSCPKTLCLAIKSQKTMRQGIYELENLLARRQVDTRELRRKMVRA